MSIYPLRAAAAALSATLMLALVSPIDAGEMAAPWIHATEVRMDHISVLEAGAGKPIILIPGLSTPRTVWQKLAETLVATHHVVLVQVNGFGGDDPGNNLQSGILEGVVADLLAYIERQQLDAPALVGHSMGGLLALMMAARHPDSVERLLVADALPFFAAQLAPGSDISVADVEPTARQLRDTIAANHGNPPDPATAEAGIQGMSLRPENREMMLSWAMAADARVTAQALFENLTTDLRPELESIKAPLTLVYPWNEQGPDPDIVSAFYRRQFASVQNIRYVDIADAAHFLMLDQPNRFREVLVDFLQN